MVNGHGQTKPVHKYDKGKSITCTLTVTIWKYPPYGGELEVTKIRKTVPIPQRKSWLIRGLYSHTLYVFL